MNEEQVVPGCVKAATRRATNINQRKKKRESSSASLVVPALRSAKRAKTVSLLSPAAEYPGKARWATPLRVGKWLERWESAREMSLHVAVRSLEHADVTNVVRTAIAEAVVNNVGSLLPLTTVLKWLCLLFEYLELNADEQVLVVCLLRKYVAAGGKFVGEGDWARPQRWECVVAISCYFSVLLTEEFPGRTSLDLRELLGPNFRFGIEQLAFLQKVDWRISIDAPTFGEVKDCCVKVANNVPGEKQRLSQWFRIVTPPTIPAAKQTGRIETAPKVLVPSPVPLSVKAPSAPYYSSAPAIAKTIAPATAQYPVIPKWGMHGW